MSEPMSELRNNSIPPSSPSRRHFLGIAAAATRRLAMVPLGTSMLSMLGSRDAVADDHRGLEQQGHPHHGSSEHRDHDSGSTWRNYSGSTSYSSSGSTSYNSSGSTFRSYASAGVRCFLRGTRIRTISGDVAIENLAIGTGVVTTRGPKPVKWIGRQTFRRSGSMTWRPHVLPVCISQFAIDDQTPRRDVRLSQQHAVFIDGVLIPARHLVNGGSVRFCEAALQSDTIEYFHVELETHEVIFADALPVETFQYSGGEVAWDNLAEYQRLYGPHRMTASFAPRHSYEGGGDEVRGLIRLAASRFVDVRDPIQIAWDRIAARSRCLAA